MRSDDTNSSSTGRSGRSDASPLLPPPAEGDAGGLVAVLEEDRHGRPQAQRQVHGLQVAVREEGGQLHRVGSVILLGGGDRGEAGGIGSVNTSSYTSQPITCDSQPMPSLHIQRGVTPSRPAPSRPAPSFTPTHAP